MILDATANIKWLHERLYIAAREMQAEGITHPTFVLLTKCRDDRHKVENMILEYFQARFGQEMFKNLMPGSSSSNVTRFHLPELDASIVLIDI